MIEKADLSLSIANSLTASRLYPSIMSTETSEWSRQLRNATTHAHDRLVAYAKHANDVIIALSSAQITHTDANKLREAHAVLGTKLRQYAAKVAKYEQAVESISDATERAKEKNIHLEHMHNLDTDDQANEPIADKVDTVLAILSSMVEAFDRSVSASHTQPSTSHEDDDQRRDSVVQMHNTQVESTLAMQSLMQSVHSLADKVAHANAPRGTPNLPALEIPTFDGTAENWRHFWELYKQIVHKSETLSDTEKYAYLRSHLVGEAYDVVKSIPVCAANYARAIDKLRHIYANSISNSRALISSMEAATAKQDWRSQLKLARDLLTIAESLEGCNEDVNSALYQRMISAKFRIEAREWLVEQIRIDRRVSTVQLLEYLEHKILDKIEMVEMTQPVLVSNNVQPEEWEEPGTSYDVPSAPTSASREQPLRRVSHAHNAHPIESLYQRQGSGNYSPSPKNPRSSVVEHNVYPRRAESPARQDERIREQRDSVWCIFCRSHYDPKTCPKSAKERTRIAHQKQLCLLCLRRGHAARVCTEQGCPCGGRHHESLCGGSHEDGHLPQTNSPKAKRRSLLHVSCLDAIMNNRARVWTTQAKVVNPKSGRSMLTTILLDTGSAVSLLTEEAAKQLNLPAKGKRKMQLSGIGGRVEPEKLYDISEIEIETFHGPLRVEVARDKGPIVAPLTVRAMSNEDKAYMRRRRIRVDKDAPSGPLQPQLLLGANHVMTVVQGGQKGRGKRNVSLPSGLTMLRTSIGFVLSGKEDNAPSSEPIPVMTLTEVTPVAENQNDSILSPTQSPDEKVEPETLLSEKLGDDSPFLASTSADVGKYSLRATYAFDTPESEISSIMEQRKTADKSDGDLSYLRERAPKNRVTVAVTKAIAKTPPIIIPSHPSKLFCTHEAKADTPRAAMKASSRSRTVVSLEKANRGRQETKTTKNCAPIDSPTRQIPHSQGSQCLLWKRGERGRDKLKARWSTSPARNGGRASTVSHNVSDHSWQEKAVGRLKSSQNLAPKLSKRSRVEVDRITTGWRYRPSTESRDCDPDEQPTRSEQEARIPVIRVWQHSSNRSPKKGNHPQTVSYDLNNRARECPIQSCTARECVQRAQLTNRYPSSTRVFSNCATHVYSSTHECQMPTRLASHSICTMHHIPPNQKMEEEKLIAELEKAQFALYEMLTRLKSAETKPEKPHDEVDACSKSTKTWNGRARSPYSSR